jgi:tetratricopeptide (TPR) repeat protein
MRKRFLLLAVAACALATTISGCGGGTEELDVRLEEADQIFRSREYEEAGTLYEAIATDAEAAGATSQYVEACAMRARSFLIIGDDESGRPWLKKAAASADPSDSMGWSRYLGVRGRFEWKSEDNEAATATFREMFDFCRERAIYDRAVDAAHMIAITGDPEERFEWAERGIAMAEEGELIGWLGPLWNNLGWDYLDAGRYEEGLEALRQAREYHHMGENELSKLIADYSVAYAMKMTGDMDGAKVGMEGVFRWAKRLHDAGGDEALEWMGFSRWELGEIIIEQGDKTAGLMLMSKALKELEEAGIADWDEADWIEKQERIEELKD